MDVEQRARELLEAAREKWIMDPSSYGVMPSEQIVISVIAAALTPPDGYVLVPVEPTTEMLVDGFESEPDEFFSTREEWLAYEAMSGCQQGHHRSRLCWGAMLAARPEVKP